jgi:hypothetical protein
VPVTVAIANNHISNEYWGIFKAGSITINGLGSNHYAGSVAFHTN